MVSKERPVLVAVITTMGVVIAALITGWYQNKSSAEKREDSLELRVQSLETELRKRDVIEQTLQKRLAQAGVDPATQPTGAVGGAQTPQQSVSASVDQEQPNVMSASLNPVPARPTATSLLVEEGEGLRVELQKCSLKGDKVTCTFAVTSTTNDRAQYLRESRLIEKDGNELRPTAQQFGRDTSGGSQVYASLVRNVTLRATVTFDAVNPEVSRGGLRLIELRFDDLVAQFRDIPVE